MRGSPTRLTAALAAATLVPLAALAFVAVRLSTSALHAEVEARLRSTAAVTSVFVQEHITGFVDVVQSYALRPNLIASLKEGNRQALELHLDQLRQSGTGVSIAFAVDMKGRLIAIAPDTPEIIGQDFSYRDYFRGVTASGGPYVSEVYISRAAGQPRVAVIAVIVREGGPGTRPLAILAVGYDSSYIGTFTRDFSRAQGTSVTVTDQRGVLVASSEQVGAGLSSHAGEPAVAAALRGEAAFLETDRGGEKVLIASAPVAVIGWTVQCMVRSEVALAPLVRVRRAVLATALPLLVVLALALVLLWRSLRLRERAEATLRESEARVAGILEAAHDAFVTIDPRGAVTAWNQQAERLFGWPRGEVLGRTLAELIIPPAQRQAHQRGMAHHLATGEGPILNRRIEVTALDRTGREFPVELTVWRASSGGVPAFHSFVHDISERRRAADVLAGARDQANEASRLKSAFLANVSHEIRTPMNGIIGMTQLVLGTELSRAQREYLTMVQGSAEALLRVINDVLDFSKIEADKLTLERAPFGLRKLVADVIRPLGARAAAKGLELVLHVGSEVPDAVSGDATRLGQVLVNIVGNAIKFTERGEVVVRVVLETRGPDSVVLRFSVSDTGIGIAPAQHQAIFESFTQADPSTTRKFGGTGLGLTISSRFVALMGGRLTVRSEAGHGATFSFDLPLGVAPEPVAAPQPIPGALDQLPVLVVDDNDSSLAALEEMFLGWRMRPVACRDAGAALAALEAAAQARRPFGLAVADAQMTGPDGAALAERLRRHPALRGGLILLRSSLSAGDDAALLKPIRQSELLEAVMSAVAGPAGSADTRPPAPVAPSRALSVLVAEDNAVNQLLARALLEKQGHRVTVARDGNEAVRLATAGGFDAVLMDVQMPGLDGLQATAAIRRHEERAGGHLPIIGVTAHAMQGDREKCLAAGMDAYVAKPIRAETLLSALAATVDAPAGKEVFDAAATLALLGQDRALMQELAAVFLLDSPRRLAEIRAAMEARDWSALRMAAHSLKASAEVLSGRRTATAALQLEQAAAGRDLPDAGAALASLEIELPRLQARLSALPR